MNMVTKQNIFKEHLEAWLQAKGDRKKRREIADNIVFITSCHPKSVSRSFERVQMKDESVPERRGRKTYYTPDVLAALTILWEASDYACGELLHPVVGEYVSILRRDKMWTHAPEATEKLLAMSLGTLKRKVGSLGKRHRRSKGHSSTKPSHLKSIIPIFKGPWNECGVGEGQLDTVAQCGGTLLGDYVFTVNYVDAATYWTVMRAQWNKGQRATVESLKAIQQRVPFPIQMIHPDSGSEFINRGLKHWCDDQGIHMTRSEPGRSNDNMYVEERNGHVVRRYLGYVRFDKPGVVPLVNELYDVLHPYLNHFKAVRRQVEKVRVGAKYVRKYEPAGKTPYHRVLERDDVCEEVKEQLKEEHARLNPLVLKRQIDTLVLKIIKFNATHE